MRARAAALVDEVSPPDGVLVIAGPPDAARIDAVVQGRPGAQVVWLTDAFTPEVAAIAHRVGARVCLFDHGAAPLRLAVDRAVEDADADRVHALVQGSVHDVVFTLRLDGERFRFSEINPAFTRATGLTAAQVVGKHVDEVIPEPSLSLVLARYREAIDGRRTVRWDEVTDYPTGRKYGEVAVTPLVDASGRCTGLLGTVADVSEARRARELADGEQRVLELVAARASLDDTLRALVAFAERLAPPAIGSILRLDADGVHLRAGAAPGLPDAYNAAIDGAAIGPNAGSCGTAAALREPVIVVDVATDPRWADYRDLAGVGGIRACWSTPIFASDGRVLGTFALYYREPRAPSEADLALIARFGHVAGIALQRHELDEQLRQLSARVEAAREDERTGIAREIHDQLGQALTVLKMDLAWIARRASTPEAQQARLAEALAQVDQIIGEVRRISAELRPGVLDDLGLDAALAWAAREFEQRTQIACVVRSGIADDEQIDRDVATAIFRVFQEALTNVVRHAHARNVDVWLEERDGALELRVKDDGQGIADDAIRDPRSLGLLGIRERARRLGGTAEVGRDVAGGTVVTLRIPRPET